MFFVLILHVLPSYTRALENRILELESNHGHNPRGASVPTPTSAQHGESHNGTGNSPSYLGRASAVGFMDEVIETSKPAEALATKALGRGTVVAEAPESSPSSWFAGNSRGDQDSVFLGVDLVLPPRRTADCLLQSYWIGAHPLLPIIHKSAFLARYVYLHSKLPIIALSHLFTFTVMREFGVALHLRQKTTERRARVTLNWSSTSCSTLYSRSGAGSSQYLDRDSFPVT